MIFCRKKKLYGIQCNCSEGMNATMTPNPMQRISSAKQIAIASCEWAFISQALSVCVGDGIIGESRIRVRRSSEKSNRDTHTTKTYPETCTL